MNKSSMDVRTINLSLPKKLVDEVDKTAKNEFATRSDFIRDAILRKLNESKDRWEVATDLTTVKKDGIGIDELLKHL